MIKIDENGVVTYENQPEEPRELFPNVQEGGGVQDVQLKGTSIVGTNGVADIPLAGTNRLGVVMPSNNGIQTNTAGQLVIQQALSSDIKEGTNDKKPIVPYSQHVSVFYGMAKAAGDTTQAASENVVGNYTDEAKTAIQKMLGVYEPPFRVIKEISGGTVSGNIYIDRDLENNALALKEVLITFDGVQASGTSSACIAINGDNQTISGANVPFLAMYNLYNTSVRNMAAHLSIKGGLFFGDYLVHAADAMAGTSIGSSLNAYGIISADAITSICIGSVSNHNFTGGTIRIMGR